MDMKMFSKRNALIGWIVLFFARRYAKRKMARTTGRLRFNR
jgi:hypothetical protein